MLSSRYWFQEYCRTRSENGSFIDYLFDSGWTQRYMEVPNGSSNPLHNPDNGLEEGDRRLTLPPSQAILAAGLTAETHSPGPSGEGI
jgi:hypothetical protein